MLAQEPQRYSWDLTPTIKRLPAGALYRYTIELLNVMVFGIVGHVWWTADVVLRGGAWRHMLCRLGGFLQQPKRFTS